MQHPDKKMLSATGSFVQVHIETFFSDLVRIDLQAALQRSISTLHLPVKRPQDNEVMMKVFVLHGVTCFSGTTFVCISQFVFWQAVLREAGKRAYPPGHGHLSQSPLCH